METLPFPGRLFVSLGDPGPVEIVSERVGLLTRLTSTGRSRAGLDGRATKV
jgi:hypothetical protein